MAFAAEKRDYSHPTLKCGILYGDVGGLCAIMGVPLLFLPKINILGFSGETAGVRIDDFFLAVLLGFLGAAFLYLRRTSYSLAEFWLLIFLSIGTLSFFLEGGTIIYTIRLLEYFVFFYIGLNAAPYINLKTVLLMFIGWNGFLIILQFFRIIGSFPLGQYRLGFAIGIGSGDWEIGLLLDIAWAALAFGRLLRPPAALLLGCFVLGLHFLVGSRTPAATFIILFIVYFLWSVRRQTGIFLLVLPILLVAAYGAVTVATTTFASSKLLKRATTLSTTDYVHVLSEIWVLTPASGEIHDYGEARKVANANMGSDISLLERAQKAISSLKFYMISSPLAWVIGTGPGRFGTAVDEGYARLLAETGIAGVIAFVLFLYNTLRNSSAIWPLMFIFFVSMVTLDTYLAYKIMSMLLFVGGMETARRVNASI